MATLHAVTAANRPRIDPDHVTEVEAIVAAYEYPGHGRDLTVDLDHADTDDHCPQLAIHGESTFAVTKPILDADGAVVDRDHGYTREFFERLAPYLDESLVVETVGHEKCRFPLLASQWTVWPDGPIRCRSFDHAPHDQPPSSTGPCDTPADPPIDASRPSLANVAGHRRRYLAELAEHDDRRLLLWELAADGHSHLGVDDIAREHDLGVAPPRERVSHFLDAIDPENGEHFDGVNWSRLEARWGHIVDAYLPHTQRTQ
jgi:hypothetical protein